MYFSVAFIICPYLLRCSTIIQVLNDYDDENRCTLSHCFCDDTKQVWNLKKVVALVTTDPLNQVNVVDLFQALQVFSVKASVQTIAHRYYISTTIRETTRTITPDLLLYTRTLHSQNIFSEWMQNIQRRTLRLHTVQSACCRILLSLFIPFSEHWGLLRKECII